MTPDLYLVPDTNVLLHFPPLGDIDWLDLCAAKSAVLLITPVVTRELNKHKDAPKSRKMRDKATAVLKEFYERFKGSKPKQLRPGVEIQFVTQDPPLEFQSYGLVRELNDDWLIASAIHLKSQYAPIRLLLATADFGLDVKAAAHIGVFQMPDALRIPEEMDSDEKKILELQRRLSTIESASPILRVAFPNEKSFSAIELFAFQPWSEERKNQELDKARAEHPPVPLKPVHSEAPFDFGLVTNKHIDSYNMDLAGYFGRLEVYFQQLNNVAAWYNRTAKIGLVLRNIGGAPAEDVDVFIHFPDGMEVLEREDVIALPEKPEPAPPFRDSILGMFGPVNLSIPTPRSTDIRVPLPRPNAQLLGVKKTNSFEVEFHVQRLKHQNDEKLPELYLHFPDEPFSFRADYRLIVANVPEPTNGSLDFIYDRL